MKETTVVEVTTVHQPVVQDTLEKIQTGHKAEVQQQNDSTKISFILYVLGWFLKLYIYYYMNTLKYHSSCMC